MIVGAVGAVLFALDQAKKQDIAPGPYGNGLQHDRQWACLNREEWKKTSAAKFLRQQSAGDCDAAQFSREETAQFEKWRVTMQASELLERIKSNNAPIVVDTRSEIEFRRGHIPGAINAPVRKILLNRASLPRDKRREMVITCEHGQRATMAKFLLGLYGYRNTALLEGYLEDWKKAGLPLES
jgi:rhodanese-related sulfurtransferase